LRARFVDAIVRLLPLEPRAARAVDETLRDWDHEAGEAATAGGRAVAHLRGLLAWLSTLARVAAYDLRGVPFSGFLARLGIVVVPPSIFLTERLLAVRRAPSVEVGQGIAVFLWPANAFMLLPLGLFVAIVWQGRRHPAQFLGVLFMSVALSVVALGEVVPLANQAYRVRVSALFHSPPPTKGASEWTIGDLIRAIDSLPEMQELRSPVLRSFSDRVAIVLWTGTFAWLGVAVARVRCRWRWAAASMAAYVALIGATVLGALAVELSPHFVFVCVVLEPLLLLPWVRRAAAAEVLAGP
jgi:hypothetical protein